jgi:hypothetical protein
MAPNAARKERHDNQQICGAATAQAFIGDRAVAAANTAAALQAQSLLSKCCFLIKLLLLAF